MFNALTTLAPSKRHKHRVSQYDKAIASDKRGNPLVDKLTIAHWLVDNKKLTLEPLDLKKQVKQVVEFIKRSNQQMPTA
jgi:hypothetical protein